jgi:hypothetical protein
VKPFVETVAVKPNLSIENDVEKYIRAEVYSTQMRIKDFFEDFDKLRKGWVTEDKVIFFPPDGSYLSIHRSSASLQHKFLNYSKFAHNKKKFPTPVTLNKNFLVPIRIESLEAAFHRADDTIIDQPI